MKEEGEVAEAAPFPEAAAAPEPHPRQSSKREHRHGVAREQREMLSEALAMSRRAAARRQCSWQGRVCSS
jgi:hypothetical protein